MVTTVGHVLGVRNGRMLLTTLFCTPYLNSHAFFKTFGPPSQPPQGDKAGFLPGGPGGIYIPLCMYRCNAAYGRPTKSEQATYVLPTTLSLGRQSCGSAIGTAVSRSGMPTPTLEDAKRLRGAQAELPLVSLSLPRISCAHCFRLPRPLPFLPLPFPLLGRSLLTAGEEEGQLNRPCPVCRQNEH